MAKITRDIIEEVKKHVSILDLASEYFELTRKRGYLGIKNVSGDSDYSSLKLFPDTNTYVRFSGKGGGDVIQFVRDTHIEGIESFEDAVLFLKKRIDPSFTAEKSKNIEKRWNELTPAQKGKKMAETNNLLNANLNLDDNCRYIIAYLKQTRGIDIDTIYNEIDNGRIAQIITKNGSRALACIGRDYNFPSVKTAVSVRGIVKNSSFKGDLKGCNYDVGWVISGVSKQYSKDTGSYIKVHDNSFGKDAHIYCFEGYIDYLSFKTIQKQRGNPMDKDICIVTGASTKTRCIINFLETNKEQFDGARVTLCFDNDEAGYKAVDRVAAGLMELNMNLKIDTAISYDKDWNEQLNNKNITDKEVSYNFSLNNECIARLSKNRGKEIIYSIYEDISDKNNVIVLDYKNDNMSLHDCSKNGLDILYDKLEQEASDNYISVYISEGYSGAVKDSPQRYPNLAAKGNISALPKKTNISDRINGAKSRISGQEKTCNEKIRCIDR